MVLISHPAPSQSTADLCAATRVVHTETRGIPWAKGKRNTWESYLFSPGTFGMCMVCMDNCKFQVFAGLSCNSWKYLFLAAPGAILSNYFLGCCGIYVPYTYDLKGTIMQIFYGHVSYPHILFLSSQLQIFKLSGYPGIWDRQILFNNLLVSAQK